MINPILLGLFHNFIKNKKDPEDLSKAGYF